MNMKRKVTRNFQWLKGKRAATAVMFSLMSGAVLFAQENTNPWVGEALPEAGGSYYLYNTKGGNFLLGGNNWGTQASLGQPGLEFTVAVSNGKYKLMNSGKGGNGGLGTDGYVDNGNAAEYTFTDPNPDDEVSEFAITLDGKTLYWSGEGSTLVNLDNSGDPNAAEWILVSQKQRVASLDAATAENGVDATFYIVGAGFERMQPSKWVETHSGGTISLLSPGGSNPFYCAEATNTNSFDVYQELTGLKPGRYELTCSGFYRSDETEALNAMLYAGVNEMPLQLGVDDGNGMPGNAKDAAQAFANGRFGGNTVSAIVVDGTLRIGVRKSVNIPNDWAVFDSFRLTYYGEASAEDAYADLMNGLQGLPSLFRELGATAAAAELEAAYVRYSGSSYEASGAEVTALINAANMARGAAGALAGAIASANNFKADAESGKYVLSTAAKAALDEAIAAANSVLTGTAIAELGEKAEAATTDVNTAVEGARGFAGLSYSLETTKKLADEIGGLTETPEYQQVLKALDAEALVYDSVATYVAALDSVISAAITPEFLAKATVDTPIDFTAFVENPNIYQKGGDNIIGGNAQKVDGWISLQWGENNSPAITADLSGDTELRAGSWSANDGNNVARAHYQAVVGGKNGIKLPAGVYELRAATYSDYDLNAEVRDENDYIQLYATPDSVNFSTSVFNRELSVFEAACAEKGTTTTVSGIIVTEGGKLYIGANGIDPTKYPKGNGRYWTADNFRLYYVGSDALNAYRSRLQTRLDECKVLRDSLFNYGIEAEDFVEIIEEASEYLEEGTVEDLISVIDELDIFKADANTVITNYLAFGPVLENAGVLYEQLNAGQVFVQPKAQDTFVNTYDNASLVASDMSWDNYLSEDIQEQVDTLQGATTVFMNSAAICYPMGTAKILADQIGGLDQTGEYQEIVRLLGEDELFQLDVDLAVQGLQGVCLEAMTPDVLAKATVENPFNMTTFIVNPNIYQDAVDVDGNPIDTEINGWICETNADGAGRTGATSGDTWLWCYSWSSNDFHNISSATNYRQVVGTQANLLEEGKYVLPTGAYRVEAATRGANLLSLYAQTNSVEISTVTSSLEEDSLVYTYTEIESADSAFNGDVDVWDEAQSLLGTTTAVPEIYVDNGAVTIGVRGEGRVGGNGQNWQADNFRLYYVGTKRGSGTGIDGTIADKTAGVEAEIVDVYDLTGVCLRKQVRRADAVKGLKKGIYVVGGKKVIVAGN